MWHKSRNRQTLIRRGEEPIVSTHDLLTANYKLIATNPRLFAAATRAPARIAETETRVPEHFSEGRYASRGSQTRERAAEARKISKKAPLNPASLLRRAFRLNSPVEGAADVKFYHPP